MLAVTLNDNRANINRRTKRKNPAHPPPKILDVSRQHFGRFMKPMWTGNN
jgi:hypothetical protein